MPHTALTIIDRAVQVYGAAGVCQNTPLAYLWAGIRLMRIFDGPDEVYLQRLGKRENRSRGDHIAAKLSWHREEADRLLSAAGFMPKGHL